MTTKCVTVHYHSGANPDVFSNIGLIDYESDTGNMELFTSGRDRSRDNMPCIIIPMNTNVRYVEMHDECTATNRASIETPP